MVWGRSNRKVVFGEKETLPPRPDRTEGVSPGEPGQRASQAGGSARIKPLSVRGAVRGQREWGREKEKEGSRGCRAKWTPSGSQI